MLFSTIANITNWTRNRSNSVQLEIKPELIRSMAKQKQERPLPLYQMDFNVVIQIYSTFNIILEDVAGTN